MSTSENGKLNLLLNSGSLPQIWKNKSNTCVRQATKVLDLTPRSLANTSESEKRRESLNNLKNVHFVSDLYNEIEDYLDNYYYQVDSRDEENINSSYQENFAGFSTEDLKFFYELLYGGLQVENLEATDHLFDEALNLDTLLDEIAQHKILELKANLKIASETKVVQDKRFDLLTNQNGELRCEIAALQNQIVEFQNLVLSKDLEISNSKQEINTIFELNQKKIDLIMEERQKLAVKRDIIKNLKDQIQIFQLRDRRRLRSLELSKKRSKRLAAELLKFKIAQTKVCSVVLKRLNF